MTTNPTPQSVYDSLNKHMPDDVQIERIDHITDKANIRIVGHGVVVPHFVVRGLLEDEAAHNVLANILLTYFKESHNLGDPILSGKIVRIYKNINGTDTIVRETENGMQWHGNK